jgi:hypothetical protein
MTRFTFWQRWLFILSLIIITFGLAMAWLNDSALFELLNRQVDPVFWGAQPLPQEAIVFRGWTYGVIGATMAGWGVFIAFLAQVPFRRRERWAWNCMTIGILAWFLPDTAISLAAGVIFNAVFNSLLLALVALPLIFTRKDFKEPLIAAQKG